MNFIQILTLSLPIIISLWASSNAYACSWGYPDGMTSEWVEDKVVFWGRPLETKWNKSREGVSPETYTNIEVIEEIRGTLPHKIKVYHHMNGANCGIYFQLGKIQLIVLPKSNNHNFKTSSIIEESVSKTIVSAYVNDGIDFQLEKVRSLRTSFYENDEFCQTKMTVDISEANHCELANAYFLAQEAYWTKLKELEEKSKKKTWWQKPAWFK
ncbi:hypothetical protein [Hellea balneolensis]|uniref:hypothetical protein n=1 Tax=Hellea balneolensis TaxID=287478 RepID=UPI00047A6514|nr:hypothetical protein [Hellea balneolensis]